MSASFLHPPQFPPFALVRRASCRTTVWTREAFELQQFALLRSRWRRHIFIELPGFRLRDVPFRKTAHDEVLFSKRRAADDDGVAQPNEAMRPRSFAVHVDLAALARLLSLGACSKQTRHIQPDIEPE